MPTYALLKSTNPDFDADYWRKIQALYAGGRRLLVDAFKDPTLLERLFPKHLGEDDDIYKERQKRAFYIPYMGQLVDYIISVIGSDPVTMTAGGDNDDTAPGSVEGFYDEFFENTSRPGGEKMSLNQLLRTLMLNALLYQRAWCLIDFPKADDVQVVSRAQQEELGLDRAYAVPLDTDQVLDWDKDDHDQLEWVLVRTCSLKRLSVGQPRNTCVEQFTVYDREGWTRYTYTYDPSKPPGKGGPPRDNQEPDSTDTGKHSFGMVPIVHLELPEGLWAGSKLESIATQHFNARCALSWGQIRSLFQILVAKLQAPDALSPITEDTDRSLNQPVGPGRVVTMAEKDSFDFVGPDAAPFTEARMDLRELRDEMYRVLQQMAQSVDNSGAALQRSAASKQVDAQSSVTLAKDLGRRLRELAEDVYDMVGRGRKDAEREWHAAGAEQFDDVSLDSLVAEAAQIELISVPSPTFQTLYKYELARRLLPGATDDQLEVIYDELSTNSSAQAEADEAMRDAAVTQAENTAETAGQPPAPGAPGAPGQPAKAPQVDPAKGDTKQKGEPTRGAVKKATRKEKTKTSARKKLDRPATELRRGPSKQ